MLPPVGNADGIVFTDASGRRMRLKVEYLEPQEGSRKTVSLPVVEVPPLSSVFQQIPVPVSAPVPTVDSAVPKLLVVTEGSRPTVAAAQPVKELYDHPSIGGKFTVFVLLYGDYYDMHARCLQAIIKTCPPERLDLRIGSNQLGARSKDLLLRLGREGSVRFHYCHERNDRKYPVMREMFHDQKNPIETKWLIWFDDDSMCDKNLEWLALLSHQIVNYPDVSMFGPLRFYRMSEDQPAWIKAAPWYRNRPFRDKGGKPVPNGDKVQFAVGAFWALKTEAMRAADIPCRRLGHNGGDWTIGEQLYQAGFKLKGWTSNKEIVNWSATPRRGLSEVHPGTKNRGH